MLSDSRTLARPPVRPSLAAATDGQMHSIVDDVVAAYEANEFRETFTAGYARIAADDPAAWWQWQAERAGEEPALHDDVDQVSSRSWPVAVRCGWST